MIPIAIPVCLMTAVVYFFEIRACCRACISLNSVCMCTALLLGGKKPKNKQADTITAVAPFSYFPHCPQCHNTLPSAVTVFQTLAISRLLQAKLLFR